MKVYDSVVNPPGTDSVAAIATAQAATASSAGALTEALNSVLKKAKPLSALVESQNQASGRQDALWHAFKQVCALPVLLDAQGARHLDPEGTRQLVIAAEEAYLAYLQAKEANEKAHRELHQAECEQSEAEMQLKQAIKAAESAPDADLSDKTLTAARYMVSLLSRYKAQAQGEVVQEREQGELCEDDLVEIEKLRQAVIDHVLFKVRCVLAHETLTPLAQPLYEGIGLKKVVSPVRPIEEEVQRYLSQLEEKIHNQRLIKVKAQPLLQERLKLISIAQAANDKNLQEVTAAIKGLNRPALWPYIWAHAQIVRAMNEAAGRPWLCDDYHYTSSGAVKPECLDAYDRPAPVAVEKDQIAYLRKQTRAVAFAMAHLNETNSAIRAHNDGKVEVAARGVSQNQSWQQCLDWHQQLQARRAQADQETLRRTTKAELLAKAKEHYEDLVKTEMTSLYKSLCAMIPRDGPKPCNELRELIDVAAYICSPLEGSEAAYPVY